MPRARRRRFVSIFNLCLFCALCIPIVAAAAEDPAGKRPNIIVILTDDQGYGDLSCHGNPILKTPHMDRLHAEGVRFTDFHVSPTCAPTRSALLTGRHEFKNGVTHTIFERERLRRDAVILPQILKSAGYVTGIFGKWHLGDEPEYWPSARGFDEMFIHGGGGIGQTYPGSCGDAPGNTYFDPAILHNGSFKRTKGYCTDVFFQQARTWMESLPADRPFFTWIATNAPHDPLQVRMEDQARYAGKVGENEAKFLGMVANIDDNIGRLLEWMRARDLDRRTLVIFMNDNGGTFGTKIFNAGMRGQKNTPWLGGTRAASFWRWPGILNPADVAAPCAHIDVLPTLAEIAGAKLDAATQAQVEGRSLVPLLRDPASVWPERALATHLGRWVVGTDPNAAKYKQCAIRKGRWRMVNPASSGEKAWKLFDVSADPGESKDVAAANPAVVAELDAAYDAWWASVAEGIKVNENVKGPAMNPFKELYWKQFNMLPGAAPATESKKDKR